MEGIQPTMNVGNNDGWGNNSGIWLFAILALMWGGFGGNRWGNGNAATTEDLNNTSNFARLESQVRANENIMQSGFTSVEKELGDLKCKLATDKGDLQLQLSKAICETNANITSNTQRVLDVLNANKIEQLQARINQLELQQSLYGVVRYPAGYTYNAGTPPFCSGSSSSSGSGTTNS